MALSKTFILVGLALAVLLVISSEVSARELAEAAQTHVDSVEEAKYGGHGHGYGHGYGHGHGHGYGHGHGHGKPGHGGHPPAGETQEGGN